VLDIMYPGYFRAPAADLSSDNLGAAMWAHFRGGPRA